MFIVGGGSTADRVTLDQRRRMKPSALLQRLAGGQLAKRPVRRRPSPIRALGFELDRVRGSHHIFRHPGIGQRLNLQASGGQAKPYRLRQFLDLVERHALRVKEDDE